MNQLEFKSRLLNVKKHNINLTSQELHELSTLMLENIGSTDAELRDSLIYSILSTWIIEKHFNEERLREILSVCLDDRHLFIGIGETDTDTVFARSFSILIVTAIIYYHNHISTFLLDKEITKIKDLVLKYASEEKDLRGYVVEKGWAHSVAHTSDCLDELAKTVLAQEDLKQILSVISKMIKLKEIVYTFGEDERMVNPVMSVIKRNVLPQGDIVQWIEEFASIDISSNWPNDYWYIMNIKSFIRSLYFRTLNDDSLNWVNQCTLEVIRDVSTKFTEY
jgi:hypothetical protein